ncbi:hypothetical protein HMSSN139_25710 [Paenibacillus sp. HMSSN-139]|nr:hypothetical protein HMSSN139_25710 [Paenibacillus sp. HMSSN-139]
MSNKAAVLVAGSWGTALASVLADKDMEVALWTRNETQKEEINTKHRNERFCPESTYRRGLPQPRIWKPPFAAPKRS